MKNITRQITLILLGTFLMAGGLGLTVNFLNGLLLIGILLIVAGASVLLGLVIER